MKDAGFHIHHHAFFPFFFFCLFGPAAAILPFLRKRKAQTPAMKVVDRAGCRVPRRRRGERGRGTARGREGRRGGGTLSPLLCSRHKFRKPLHTTRALPDFPNFPELALLLHPYQRTECSKFIETTCKCKLVKPTTLRYLL